MSGTPGTGKSVFAHALASELSAQFVELNALIEEKKTYRVDPSGAKVANLRRMREEFADVLKDFSGPVVVEGLLAHLLSKKHLSHVIVLRCKPRVLERRLRVRGYSNSKTQENIEAEVLDIILWEAVQEQGIQKVYEIDTTRVRPKATVKLFLDALAGKVSLKPGKISWLEEFYKKGTSKPIFPDSARTQA